MPPAAAPAAVPALNAALPTAEAMNRSPGATVRSSLVSVVIMANRATPHIAVSTAATTGEEPHA